MDILARKRFVKGIAAVRRQLAQSGGSGNNSSNISNVAPPSISSMSVFGSGTMKSMSSSGSSMRSNTIVSKAEHQAISKLYVRFDEASRIMNDLHHSFNVLSSSKTKCLKKIEIDFTSLFKELETKKGELLLNIDELKGLKLETLHKQLEILKNHLKIVANAKKKYEEYVCDRSLDSQSRKRIVLRMTNDILNDPKISLLMSTQPKVLFSHKKMDKCLTNFGNSLKIDDCDQPRPFTIKITKSKYNYIQIEIRMDNESLKMAQVKAIKNIAIEWARLPRKQESMLRSKSGRGGGSHSKSKRKKKKKSKKNKRKRKGKDRDSSDSDSSDSSDSDSSDSDEESDDSDSDSDNDKNEIVMDDIDSRDIANILDTMDEDDIEWNANVRVTDNSEIKQKKKRGKDNDDSNDSTAGSDDDDNDNKESKEKEKDNSGDSSSDDDDDEESERKKGVDDYDSDDSSESKMNSRVSSSKLKKFCKKGKLSYKIEELKDNKAYLIRVCGMNQSGWGIYSSLIIGSTKKLVIDSKILSGKEKVQLMKFIPKGAKSKWKLIYRASINGFSGSTFHSICNGKSPTVVVVHTTLNYVFGGYTSMAWTSNGNYARDNQALIFLLRSQRKDKPQKWGVQNVGYSVNHNGSYGPTFGMCVCVLLLLCFNNLLCKDNDFCFVVLLFCCFCFLLVQVEDMIFTCQIIVM